MNPTTELHRLGQRLWLDNITRDLLVRGTLQRYVRDLAVSGLTSNPSIFDHAIRNTNLYDDAIRDAAARGRSGEALFLDLALEDLTEAADLFRPIHDATAGIDGWASLEVSPLLADDAAATVRETVQLYARARRPNLFIKIPGTRAGVTAIEESIFAGVPVNVTLLFSREQYVAAAEAYMRGVERRIAAGLDPKVDSVASIFVSRWDVAVKDTVPPALRNRLGIAIAKRTYKAYRELLISPRWGKLAAAGARPQRLLWASTGSKDPEASDTFYIEALAAPDTINTMPDKTLLAFADHGELHGELPADGGDAEATLAEIARAGVDDAALAEQLLREGTQSFAKSWASLMECIAAKVRVPRQDGRCSADEPAPTGLRGAPVSSRTRVSHPMYRLLPTNVEGFDSLAELALDLRCSWNHGADPVWQQLDPALWELTHNPWGVLQTVSRDRIERLSADPLFRERVDELVQAKRQAAQTPAWFQHAHPGSALTCIAYFSMEFMLSEALPIYSGGLGNVAGDQLKAASDLGVPVIGVGLLYSQGYFRQLIDSDGAQQAVFPYNDPGQLPITPLRQANGEWLRIRLDVLGHPIWLRAWQVQVGRATLYLLDSNDAANFPPDRGITSELYGGGPQLRLMQELVLGIGGWRLLAALGIEPEVCHLNEGHAAFAVLERARGFMQASGQPFEVALAVTRAGNLFTTHTAVAAGFDRFPPALIEHCLGDYAEKQLGITLHEFLALGRLNPSDSTQDFNMAYLAIRGSGAVNGVSRLHGAVSRHLFQPLFLGWPTAEVPVGHVTNGVHMPSWDSAHSDALWTQAAGKTRWLGTMETLESGILRISDVDLWRCRNASRQSLIDYARERLSRQLAASGASHEAAGEAQRLFDPNALTLGFARRFAVYKRPNLLLHDSQRLLRLLTNPARPMQLIIAGKAHPADQEGLALIQQWIRFIRHSPARQHVIFLSDYDMLLAEHLVQGVDVWLNTPRRPWEACGTSGMKVLVNGGINLSELDGWWSEAYTPEVGWAVGDCQEHGENPAHDAAEAEALYDLLERQVIPEFYCRDQSGIPTAWVARMRNSMARLTPRFSTNRTVREYTEQHYLPAAVAYRERAADKGASGVQMIHWRRALEQKWAALHLGEVSVVTVGEQHAFEVQVHLDGIEPGAVRVELYAEALDRGPPVRQEMDRAWPLPAAGGYVYCARVPASRPITDYTPRIVAHRVGVAIPLEADFILWQR